MPNLSFVPPDHQLHEHLVTLLEQERHNDLVGVRIQLFWLEDARPDDDGRFDVGHVSLASQSDRMLHQVQLKVYINKALADRFIMSDQYAAALDSLLMRVVTRRTKNGTVKADDEGKPKLRIRKPDIFGYRKEVELYGPWRDSLQLPEVTGEMPLFEAVLARRDKEAALEEVGLSAEALQTASSDAA